MNYRWIVIGVNIGIISVISHIVIDENIVNIKRFKLADLWFIGPFFFYLLASFFITIRTYLNAKELKNFYQKKEEVLDVNMEKEVILLKPLWQKINFVICVLAQSGLAILLSMIILKYGEVPKNEFLVYLGITCLFISAILNLYHLKRK